MWHQLSAHLLSLPHSLPPYNDGGIIPDSPFMSACPLNCSGHGECTPEGACLCKVWFTGGKCNEINAAYSISFTSFFYIVAAITVGQLAFRISQDYTQHCGRREVGKSKGSRPLGLTNQKLLYALIIVAAVVRGTYFVSKDVLPSHWSAQLLSAYYPLIITCFSVLVCSWAEMFHMANIPVEEPRFLGKSRVAFFLFNSILYVLLVLEMTLVALVTDLDYAERIIDRFNACFALLMLVLLITFLGYGVEMYFKIHGAFTSHHDEQTFVRTEQEVGRASSEKEGESEGYLNIEDVNVDGSQVAMSRLGLVSQGLLQLCGVLLLALDSAKGLWMHKVPVSGQNFYDVIFRVVEFGIVVWFPCVLWDCRTPSNLWVLNPRKLLLVGRRHRGNVEEGRTLLGKKGDKDRCGSNYQTFKQSSKGERLSGECYICYDVMTRSRGALISPCLCSGDVSVVHHHCLKRWLLENQRDAIPTGDFHCNVCKEKYRIRWGWGSVGQWLRRPSALLCLLLLSLMLAFPVGAYYVCSALGENTYVLICVIGASMLLELVIIRLLAVIIKKQMEELALDGMIILNRSDRST